MFHIPTLLYHHINESFVNNITITPRQFEEQLDYLRANSYNVVSLDTALAWLQTGQAVPQKSVLITFDDGYEDFYTAAFPLLQTFNYPATVFPVIEATGHWNEWNRRAPYIARHLSWPQIEELSRHNITFGCHTLSHHSLVRFDEPQIHHQLKAAQTTLSQKIGQPVTALSYPYGDHNPLTRRIAAEIFQIAFSVDSGGWDWNTHRFAIRRLKIGPDTTLAQIESMLNRAVHEDGINYPVSRLPDVKT